MAVWQNFTVDTVLIAIYIMKSSDRQSTRTRKLAFCVIVRWENIMLWIPLNWVAVARNGSIVNACANWCTAKRIQCVHHAEMIRISGNVCKPMEFSFQKCKSLKSPYYLYFISQLNLNYFIDCIYSYFLSVNWMKKINNPLLLVMQLTIRHKILTIHHNPLKFHHKPMTFLHKDASVTPCQMSQLNQSHNQKKKTNPRWICLCAIIWQQNRCFGLRN